jgi:hypothetical protein
MIGDFMMNTMSKSIDNFPKELKYTQEWFAGIITQPLGEKERILSMSPSGMLIAEEAAKYIVPNEKMRPHQRMQIYNQQYWWRLLNTMHTNFPFLTRLFGYHAFNEEIAIPYLLDFPPNTWMLSFIGKNLPNWIKENYKKSDLPLIQNAAMLDWAFTDSYLAPQYPQLDLSSLKEGEDPSHFLSYTFYLQPHAHLFKWDYNLFTFREQFMEKDVNYWTEHRFPKLPKVKGTTYSYVLYRNINNKISFKEITHGEYFLLDLFKKGATIEAACEAVEEQENSLYESVATNLQQWLQSWIQMGILTKGEGRRAEIKDKG